MYGKVEMELCRIMSENKWESVYFCAWLSVDDSVGAVVEWNNRPIWVPLDRLRFKKENENENTRRDGGGVG